jgi:hypothetical protein
MQQLANKIHLNTSYSRANGEEFRMDSFSSVAFTHFHMKSTTETLQLLLCGLVFDNFSHHDVVSEETILFLPWLMFSSGLRQDEKESSGAALVWFLIL